MAIRPPAPAEAPSEEWEVEALRLTLFPSPAAELQPNQWWETTMQERSESQTHNRRTGSYEEYGPYGLARLTLRTEPGRIDWYLRLAELSAGLPTIGRFSEVAESFAATFRRWLGLAPSAVRLGYGATLLHEVPDHATGYGYLDQLLPAVQLSANSSDFLYRINRPRPSTAVDGLRINRMSTWAVLRLMYSGLAGDVKGLRVLPASTAYACRVELDINTVPEYAGTFEPPTSSRIFDELMTLGAEIARRGDVE